MPINPEVSAPTAPSAAPTARASSRAPVVPTGDPWRERLRRWVMAAAVGAAVIVAPGGPSPGRGPGWRPPAYVQALRWRDIVRLRLSPWLLSGFFGRPTEAEPLDDSPSSGAPPELRPEPPGEPRSP